MAKGNLLVLLAFVISLSAALTWKLGYSNAASPETAPTNVPLRVSEMNEFRGMTLQLHNGQEHEMYFKLIDEIASHNVNTLSLVFSAFQENCSSTSIFIDIRKVPPDDVMRKMIRYARDKGLRVTMMPIVLLENPRDGEWRGKISPEGGRWDEWWEDYTNYIMHYTYIAQETGVEIFIVGSELISTESQTERWKALIGKVRGAYDGKLCYSANWDHYRVPQFWGDLDVVGMTTYYELTGGKDPTEETLAASWRKIKRDINDWQVKSKINGPLLFTEVGWPNQQTAAQYPWDYYRSQDKPDPDLQARCFKTFFDAWANEPGVAGFLVWEWRTHIDQVTAPQKDTTYVPKDKPAMKIINRFFASGGMSTNSTSKPAATAPAR